MRLELCVVWVLVGLGGCAATPPPHSLQGIRVAAEHDAFKNCVQEVFWQHRHVPVEHLWRSCENRARHAVR